MGGNPGSKCYEECLQPFADLLRTKKLACAKEGTETLETHAWAVVSPTFSRKLWQWESPSNPETSDENFSKSGSARLLPVPLSSTMQALNHLSPTLHIHGYP